MSNAPLMKRRHIKDYCKVWLVSTMRPHGTEQGVLSTAEKDVENDTNAVHDSM